MPNQTDQQSSSFLQSETDEQLVNAAVKLPRDMTPERDLWPSCTLALYKSQLERH